jgi:hypothetical protein
MEEPRMSSNQKIDPDFTINKIKHLDEQFDHSNEVDQPPFFLNMPGPPTIRGKSENSEPYKAET